MNMDTNGQNENGEDDKVDESVNKYGLSISAKATKFNEACVSWYLK